MSRVSENSSRNSINYSISKTKNKLENLQLQGSNLKRIQKPSDDPIGNIQVLATRSKKIDGEQYLRNSSVAKTQLSFTENAIEELTELATKAKELAIAQSSNLFDGAIRKSVAKEVSQLHDQAFSVANRRIGNKYIFSGLKTLTKPFDSNGNYVVNNLQSKIEVAKDIFVPITFDGKKIFYQKQDSRIDASGPLANSPLANFENDFRIEKIDSEIKAKQNPEFFNTPTIGNDTDEILRIPASEEVSTDKQALEKDGSIFSLLKSFENALITNNHEIIQSLLPRFDGIVDQLIEVRTNIGSTLNKIDTAIDSIDKENLLNEEFKSKIEDADVAQLYSDLARQESILNATYKSSAQLMNNNLMKYIN